MRILWFTNTSSCYNNKSRGYNGGGWISSLEQEIKKMDGIELGICFYTKKGNTPKKDVQDGTIYYLIPRPRKSFLYTWITFRGKFDKSSHMQEAAAVPALLKVVNDFKPDIIQVFGSENIYGLIAKYVSMPLILHIQGLLSPCFNAFLPPFVSWRNYLYQSKSIRGFLYLLSEKVAWQRNCITEKRMLRGIKYFMGRTEWDRRMIKLLSPRAKYYYCNEILRNTFYCLSKERVLPQRPIFVTTISSQLYKGYDLVLKTAKILKDVGFSNFSWIVFGDINPVLVEKICDVEHGDVNVDLRGVASAEEIKDALLHATAYVHTSYIDNSPNSVCEAAMLGVATISTNVGGISSLIKDGENGFLVPANDPYQMASLMIYLYENADKNILIGKEAQRIAMKRHDKRVIVKQIWKIYSDILGDGQND